MTLPGFTADKSFKQSAAFGNYRVGSYSLANIYNEAIRNLSIVLGGEEDLIANLANTVAVLKIIPKFFWVGFYLVKGQELVLGPFQGASATTRIPFGKGVCGYCAVQQKAIIVPDVHRFPGHIACDPLSRSEIALPVFGGDKNLRAVLDVDSVRFNDFDEIDLKYLQAILEMLRFKF